MSLLVLLLYHNVMSGGTVPGTIGQKFVMFAPIILYPESTYTSPTPTHAVPLYFQIVRSDSLRPLTSDS